MSEDQGDEKCQGGGPTGGRRAGSSKLVYDKTKRAIIIVTDNPLERLMSEHEAACQQAFAPRVPEDAGGLYNYNQESNTITHRCVSHVEFHPAPVSEEFKDQRRAELMRKYGIEATSAPRVPDVTGEGCADRSAPGAVGDIYIRSHDDIPVTGKMRLSGMNAALKSRIGKADAGSVEAIYRAMAAVAPNTFEPTDADVKHLAIAMLAGANDCSFSEAVTMFNRMDAKKTEMNIRAARAAFDHPGYLPSIRAARQDVANQRKALVSAPPQPDWKGERDNLLELAIDQANQINALEAERNAAFATLETARLCVEALRDAAAAKDTEIDTLKAQLAAFTAADPQPAVPDPPIRRPDGTLAPQPKPWSPPKHGGDPRRIGG